MNPVLIFIPVAAAIVLFFMFKPAKKKEDLTPNVIPDPSEPVINYPIAFEPEPVPEVNEETLEQVQPEEVVPAKPKKAAAKKKAVKK